MVFERYQDAMPHLKTRLGRYCSFCERKVVSNLAVEHKQPKSAAPTLERDWRNLLLACGNCNSAKGRQVVDDTSALWPDRDNTFSALRYLPSGRVQPRVDLGATTHRRAARLLALVGLDRGPGELPTDHRWFDRLEIWRLAQDSVQDFLTAPAPAAVKARIVTTALAMGGFSIWMAAFAEVPAMQEALIAAFPGTVVRPPYPEEEAPL